MSDGVALRIDWCSHEAARYACERWHYSRVMPAGKMVRVGVWEDSAFIGCVLFSRGANNHLGSPYRLEQTAICELTRVALTAHVTPVSRILSISVRFLRTHCPGIRLLVSFADPYRGHHGGIYQAGNWLYLGQSSEKDDYVDRTGKRWHSRQVSESGYVKQFGSMSKGARKDQVTAVRVPGKHRYLLPFDPALRAVLDPLRQPYPTRVSSAGHVPRETSRAPATQRHA